MFQIVEPAPLENVTFQLFLNKASDLLTEGRAILAKRANADK
ncbi:hypothetical protein VIBR0546_02021 [Vibrio brasiliensis LMG 20546]|uniref:Uncharacterized protein n=1 Tax=Vibrio brasiliensis LMG 20546 TaxID=945543 RepID=E8LPL8_9VIBR|nr:hypothetical protein VIBR0546_02021 [Vibrio brasiliensis LMG 20546]